MRRERRRVAPGRPGAGDRLDEPPRAVVTPEVVEEEQTVRVVAATAKQVKRVHARAQRGIAGRRRAERRKSTPAVLVTPQIGTDIVSRNGATDAKAA